ncbi:cellulase family glycosylhydrolase [Planctomicrobium piriforme]|uniref:Cellulase (Glycosyl hydrolase family 5) n=1 Tax=Planctomicrobium piriforme TaxID=1576369 RepID=A0A1I3SK62_9PLAN|nr:cellulase family glycosylhydrolase [Planctomicrobium piriforme]SFJ58119.1 Cellulase (glycosyl hydrolase family 5) [Planctomicrobium piriforme]
MSDRNASSLSRRDMLTALAAIPVTAALAKAQSPAPAKTPPTDSTLPNLHVYDSYGWLRGFSVVPSWGARIEDAWWSYEPAQMRAEIAPARAMHANCIRLWIEFTAWMAAPEQVTAHFLDAVAAIDEAGMKTMPCLFNRWHDARYDYGGTYLDNLLRDTRPHLDYVRALVTPLAGDDRILIWDLCNEPQAGATWAKEMTAELVQKEHAWLQKVRDTVRECGARQPITVGTMAGANIETFADLCDVLCGHPYAHDRTGLEQRIAEFKGLQQKYHKPFLVNECMPGAEDDRERGAVAAMYDELLSAAGFGWMGWALREGKAISTRRDRVDGNGLKSFGFHPFVLKDGQLRQGLEALTAAPHMTPPWLVAVPDR